RANGHVGWRIPNARWLSGGADLRNPGTREHRPTTLVSRAYFVLIRSPQQSVDLESYVRIGPPSLVLLPTAALASAGRATTPSSTTALPSVQASSTNRPPGAVWPDEGPATWAPRPTVTDITANDLRTRLYQFSDDSMQGRRIGEVGNLKGTSYIASEFQRLGLKPAGDSGTFFQNLPYGTLKVDSTVARLIAAGSPAGAGSEWIPAAAATGPRVANNADVTDANAVFAGRWGDTLTPLDANAIRGKTAVFTYAPARGGRGGGNA